MEGKGEMYVVEVVGRLARISRTDRALVSSSSSSSSISSTSSSQLCSSADSHSPPLLTIMNANTLRGESTRVAASGVNDAHRTSPLVSSASSTCCCSMDGFVDRGCGCIGGVEEGDGGDGVGSMTSSMMSSTCEDVRVIMIAGYTSCTVTLASPPVDEHEDADDERMCVGCGGGEETGGGGEAEVDAETGTEETAER